MPLVMGSLTGVIRSRALRLLGSADQDLVRECRVYRDLNGT